MKFEDLPIIFDETEYHKDGWKRDVRRQSTISELLKTWDIDDPTENSEMAQVLRHLRRIINNTEQANECSIR